MAVAYYIRFAVEGTGYFPVDMLRYDGCYPSDTDAVLSVPIVPMGHRLDAYSGNKGIRLVRLVHVCSDRKWQPTAGRWESFGWRVVQVQMPIAV